MSGRAEPCTASLQPLRRSERAGRRLRSFRRSVVLCAPLHPAPPRPRLSWALLEPGLPLNSLTSWIRTIRAPPPSPCARSPAWGGELMPLIPLMPMIRAPPRYRPLACRHAPTFSASSARFARPTLSVRSLAGDGNARQRGPWPHPALPAGWATGLRPCEEAKSRRVEESEQPKPQAARGSGRGRLPKIAGADYARVCVQWVARRTGLPQAGPSETSGTCHGGDPPEGYRLRGVEESESRGVGAAGVTGGARWR
jgi:hypothetical protein